MPAQPPSQIVPPGGESERQPRGSRPRPPAQAPGLPPSEAFRQSERIDREAQEHRSVLRGLLWLVALALVIALWRAGLQRSFYAGWWRQW